MRLQIQLLIHKTGSTYFRHLYFEEDGEFLNSYEVIIRDRKEFEDIWDKYHFTLDNVSEDFGQYYFTLMPLHYKETGAV